jgi:hypothetical protein
MSNPLGREQMERLIGGLINAPNRKAAHRLIPEVRNPRSDADAAYIERCRWLRKIAWREGPPPGAVWGEWEANDLKAIDLHRAFMEFHRTGEAAPLTPRCARWEPSNP